MQLDARLRRLTAYLYVQDLLNGSVVEAGPADARTAALLGKLVAGRGTVSQAPDPLHLGLADGAANVVLALEVDPGALDAVVAEARRVLKPDGVLVVGCESRDRPGAKRGVSYYDLVDRVEGKFGAVTMIGQAPFAGATLVEYGVKDPEPVLDGTLVDKGERVEWYLLVAGPRRQSVGGYAVVQVPVGELPAEAATMVAAPLIAPAPKPAPRPAQAPSPTHTVDLAELTERFRQREKAIEEAKDAALKHLAEMKKLQAELREKQACISELELDAREREGLRGAARRAEVRADKAEADERQARLKVAQLEGRLLAGATSAGSVAVGNMSDSELVARATQLEAENAKLKQKEEDARADSWKHLKGRSEAEAQAAEVREDTVRKLKDARKLASVELMRAMEEATKKAVGLREELTRSERERKELLAELNQLRTGNGHARDREVTGAASDVLQAARAREESDAAVLAVRAAAQRTVHEESVGRAAAETAERSADARLDSMRGQVVALERELEEARRLAEAERERSAQLGELVRRLESDAAHGAVAHGSALDAAHAERERFGRMLSEVEAEAKRRADLTVRSRQQLKERASEVEALRREVADRDARLISVEKLHPPAAEVERMEAELAQARTRLSELKLDLERKEAAAERAAAAAGHERARAERLVAEERRAMGERNEARARAAEAEARTGALSLELERLQQRYEVEAERARKLENEVRERKERVKQLKRELEDAERRVQVAGERAAQIDLVRERLATMEAALRSEEQRMAGMEEALRRAAAETNGAPQP